MTVIPKSSNFSRRGFLVGTAAAGGGLAIGLDGAAFAQKAGVSPAAGNDVGIWVIIKPNDDVVARMDRIFAL